MDTRVKLPKLLITNSFCNDKSFTKGNERNYGGIKPPSATGQQVARRLWRRASVVLALPLLHVDVKSKRVANSADDNDNFLQQPTLPAFRFDVTESNRNRYVGRKTQTISLYAFQKDMMAKFRMAGTITIFCARKFKQHCLR